MFKSTSDIAKDIRTELKELGFNSRKISVRKHDCNVILVTRKDESIDKDEIRQIANKHKVVDYCEQTGEILAGGNVFVSVD